MAQILVPLLTGPAFQIIPTGPQLSAKYELVGPDNTRIVFNDPKDPDYVGVLTDATGLDGPEVRESADDLVQMDGGVHGNFYYGRRPISLEGILLNPLDTMDRNQKMTKFMAATNAMRSDATLSWTLRGGYQQFVKVRRQQSPRFSGNWQKTFQVGLVASDPRIYGINESTVTVPLSSISTTNVETVIANFNCINYGNTEAPLSFTLNGSNLANVRITNYTKGMELRFNASLFNGSETITVNTFNRTVYSSFSGSAYSKLLLTGNTSWFGVAPGVNNIIISAIVNNPLTPFNGGTTSFYWRDTWL